LHGATNKIANNLAFSHVCIFSCFRKNKWSISSVFERYISVLASLPFLDFRKKANTIFLSDYPISLFQKHKNDRSVWQA